MPLRRARLAIVSTSLFVGGAFLVLAPRPSVGVVAAHAAQSYSARGTVASVARDRSAITVAHEAIPGFMPAMTMSFEARSPQQLDGIQQGDRVSFSFTVTDEGRRLIDSIRRAAKPR
ncbi:MAG TPA: copper-binding protein [Polyangiaceae bacterium]|nr:copper-binding protein [Polyangiaceae bacterium]